MVRKKNVAVIPARGGSKRIPNKNIIEFDGMPMIAKTIIAAQDSKLFERIIVSTDDEKIAEIAKLYGIEVPFLREKANDDFSPISQATIVALNQAKNFFDEEYEYVIQLMANCPLRTKENIIESYENFITEEIDFQISCFQFGWMNPWWAVALDERMNPRKLFPVESEKRSQDLDNLYCPTGAIWIAKYNKLMEEKTFYGSGYKMFPINWLEAVDIDNYEDLEMAKAFLKLREKDQ